MMERDSIEDQLSKSEFDVNGYIKSVAYRFDSSEDLKKHKKQIQSVAEKTAGKLKHNVYQNYALFIDTSREISALESEMYQLSHLLNEHQGLTSNIQSVTPATVEDSAPLDDESEKHTIASLLETVEGSAMVTDVPGRHIVYASNLREFDSSHQKMEPLEMVRAFLLNDSLLLATLVKIKRKGPIKYHFQALYELDNLAVVNLKDTEKLKCLFQIRMFPESHTFQAESEAVKNLWMKHLETTKQKLSYERQTFKQIFEVSRETSTKLGSRRTREGGALLNRQMTEVALPQWVKDAPENLDVYIAQREFEQAVNLIDQVKLYLKDSSDQLVLRNTRARVNYRVNLLGEVLMKELQSSPSGSLRGGANMARKTVRLLLRLGRSSKACELFLANHSRINEHELKQIKLEGATTIYITNVSGAFFASLVNAASEFKEAFKNNQSSFSSFVTWSIRELDLFLKQYCIEGIFPPVKSNLNFQMVADCVHTIRTQCESLLKSGLDLDFKVMNFLHPHLEKALGQAQELLQEKISVIGETDTWDPMDCRQNQAQVAEVIVQLDNIGVPSPSNIVVNGIVDLSKTTFSSCKLILNYVDCYFKIHTPDLLEGLASCLSDLFRHVIGIVSKAMEDTTLLPKTDFLIKNAELLIFSVLPALALKIEKRMKRRIPEMMGLHEELKSHMELMKSGVPRAGEGNEEEEEDDSDEENGLV